MLVSPLFLFFLFGSIVSFAACTEYDSEYYYYVKNRVMCEYSILKKTYKTYATTKKS